MQFTQQRPVGDQNFVRYSFTQDSRVTDWIIVFSLPRTHLQLQFTEKIFE